jgi:hypoxanthine phosphoribosyltransferase
MDTLQLSNTQVHGLVAKILRDIATSGERFDYIAGVTRGGLVPANLISQYLNLPMITINWSLRDNARTDLNAIERMAELLLEEKRILLVDDICDEGDTLQAIWENMYMLVPSQVERQFPSAVLVHNLAGKRFVPDFSGMEINKTELPVWLEFPWENWWLPQS